MGLDRDLIDFLHETLKVEEILFEIRLIRTQWKE